MSIAAGLARNRALYRSLFGEEEGKTVALPGQEDFSFPEPPSPEAPEEVIYRLTEAVSENSRPQTSTGNDEGLADDAVTALLRKLDDEARLTAQDLEGE